MDRTIQAPGQCCELQFLACAFNCPPPVELLSPFEMLSIVLPLVEQADPNVMAQGGTVPHPYAPSDVLHVLCGTGQLGTLSSADKAAYIQQIQSFQQQVRAHMLSTSCGTAGYPSVKQCPLSTSHGTNRMVSLMKLIRRVNPEVRCGMPLAMCPLVCLSLAHSRRGTTLCSSVSQQRHRCGENPP